MIWLDIESISTQYVLHNPRDRAECAVNHLSYNHEFAIKYIPNSPVINTTIQPNGSKNKDETPMTIKSTIFKKSPPLSPGLIMYRAPAPRPEHHTPLLMRVVTKPCPNTSYLWWWNQQLYRAHEIPLSFTPQPAPPIPSQDILSTRVVCDI